MGPLLVTGGTGYLGGELLRQAAGRPLAATYLSSTPRGEAGVDWIELDVRDAGAVSALLERVRPSAVVHTAYRQEGEGARETTVDGAAAMAAAAAAVGARLVHLSSDVIFDGTKPSPYDESDAPSPITEYGRAKADAELAVAEAHPEALLARTSLIYGGGGASRHERLAIEAARGEGDLGFFDDELRCPVLVHELAAAAARAPRASRAGCPEPRRSRGGEPLRVRVPGGRRGGASHRADPAHVDRGGPAHAPAQLRARQRTRRRAAAHAAAGRPRAAGRRAV